MNREVIQFHIRLTPYQSYVNYVTEMGRHGEIPLGFAGSAVLDV